MPSIFFLFLKSPLLLIHSSNKHSLSVYHMADITEALEDCVRPHLCPSGAEISGRDRLINRPRNAIHNCSLLLISHTSHTKSPLESKELKPVNLKEIDLSTLWKDWCWSWSSDTWATWCKQLAHWKSPWCWQRLKAEGEEGDREWDGWLASPVDMSLGKFQEMVKDRETWHATVHWVMRVRHHSVTEQQH